MAKVVDLQFLHTPPLTENPAVLGDWTTVPTTVQEALDLIASGLGPIP